MKKNKPIVFTLVLALSMSSLAYAKEQQSSMSLSNSNTTTASSENTTNKTQAELLEKAILAVKKKINIPNTMTEFNYYYYSPNNSSTKEGSWRLNWNNKTYTESLMVVVDQSGHITEYRNNQNQIRTLLPKYRKSELEKTARTFLKTIDDEIFNQTRLKQSEYNYGSYIYVYERVVNQTVVEDNQVTVSVNAVTGQVSEYRASWLFDMSFKTADKILKKEEAKKLLSDKLTISLKYSNRYDYDAKGKLKITAFLTYVPDQEYLSVDVLDKSLYTDNSTWVYKSSNEESFDTVSEAAADKNTSAGSLADYEQDKVDDLSKYISKEKAIEAITKNSSLLLDKNLKSVSAELSRNYNYRNKDYDYIWNITLEDPRPLDEGETYRAYASATVDALNGNILSFYTNLNNKDKDKIKYSNKESQKKFETFLKRQISEYFNSSILSEDEGDFVYPLAKDDNSILLGGYSYRYNRVNEGVEYPFNYIRGSVDSVTGKIFSYNFYWDQDIKFESPKDIITSQKAKDIFLSDENIALVYEANTINHYDLSKVKDEKLTDYSDIYYVEYEMRYLYKPNLDDVVIAKTGKLQSQSQLDGNKEVVNISYKDIQDTKENYNIFLLADMNIGFEGDNFNPNKEITQDEFHQLLSKISYYREQEKKDTKVMTKTDMVNFMVDYLGIGKFASLENIYVTGYKDENEIPKDIIGGVAILKSIGVLEQGDYFKPKDVVTRRQAVDYIVRFIDKMNYFEN